MIRRHMLPLALLMTAAASLALLGIADQAGWTAHGPTPLRLGWFAWSAVFVAEWTLMTGAMMLPSSIPFLNAVNRVGGATSGWVAAGGYVAVWGLLGALLCTVLWLAGDGLARLPPGTAEKLAGISLLAAAAYQLSPLAQKCQRACAQPFAILARRWRGGEARLRGAWAAGLHYGVSCVGCCVAMIALMIVVGLHDLLWMFLLAGLMVLQKHVHWGRPFALGTSAAIGAGGLLIVAGWWTPVLYGLSAICRS